MSLKIKEIVVKAQIVSSDAMDRQEPSPRQDSPRGVVEPRSTLSERFLEQYTSQKNER